MCGISKLKTLFTKTKEKFIEESNLIHNNKYDYSKTDYINDSTKLIVICPIHGEFEQLANKHLQGNGCKGCQKSKTASSFKTKYSEIFIDRAKKVHGDKYTYLEYIAMRKNMKIICKKHGEFEQRPDNHLRGNGCPSCDISFGETLIQNYLNNSNIKFKKEKTFDGCKNKLKLPFDFYLEEKNTIIEFDGIQHYEPIDYFGGLEAFEYRKSNDKIKNEYCKNNNIRLIRIPYFKIKEIDDILAKELAM